MHKLKLSKKDICIYIKGFGIIYMVFYLFYRNFYIVFFITIPISLIKYKIEKNDNYEEYKWNLNLEFKDGLQGISAALNAGYSLENSFGEAINDLKLIYGESSLLVPWFEDITNKLNLNIPIEKLLSDFAIQSEIEDIKNFADVICTAKRTGGDIISITRNTSDKISQKIEVSREIHSMIAGKKMESNIMIVIPLAMIAYLWVTSPGFLNPLYETVQGRMIMSLLIGVYIAAYLISCNIVKIKI